MRECGLVDWWLLDGWKRREQWSSCSPFASLTVRLLSHLLPFHRHVV